MCRLDELYSATDWFQQHSLSMWRRRTLCTLPSQPPPSSTISCTLSSARRKTSRSSWRPLPSTRANQMSRRDIWGRGLWCSRPTIWTCTSTWTNLASFPRSLTCLNSPTEKWWNLRRPCGA
uniref:Uncharacterized protein n=1 Tax=Cacopsylla melanoneura TaxID=428564 RepID=A0A8D8S5P8_9HEMI